MAEFRFPQSAGSYYYGQHIQAPQQPQPHHPRHQITRNTTPPGNLRSSFETPSPPRSPNSPAAQNHYGMFSQGHQGQHTRVNGAAGRGMPLMYNFQHQTTHQQQHTQHHLQQEHANPHGSNGIGHHSGYSSGVLSNSTPSFTPSNNQNGQAGTTRGGQAQQITEHWAEQLTHHKEAVRIHQAMIEQGAPNHFARTRAGENRGLSIGAGASEVQHADNDEEKDPARMAETLTVKRRQDWSNLDLSGQGLRVLGQPLFNFDFLSELYISSNKLHHLPAAIGQLRHLRHLDASHNQLTELPVELGMCVKLEKLMLFDNQLRTLPFELGALFKLELLGIEGNTDFDASLRQEMMDKGTVALMTHLRENAPIPLPPSKPREVLDLQGGAQSDNQDKIKVLSYNILANNACTTKAYGYAPTEALSWEYRKEKILQEIVTHDADVVCLQECELEAFEDYFSVKLAYSGYKGTYYQRTRAKTMPLKDQKHVDGCATFYKQAKLILLDKQPVEFTSVVINRPDMKQQSDMYNRFMPRDHIALFTFFENRYTGSRVLLANTHIFWDPAYADVKLIQVAILMQSLDKAAEKYSKWPACTNKKPIVVKDGIADSDAAPAEPLPELAPSKVYNTKTQLPLILCSDLNSTTESGVYELLSKGSVSPDHKELRGFAYGDYTKYGVEHPFQIRSAYTHLDKTPDAVTFTNYTTDFRGIIDHIWYSTNTLENVSLLGPVDPEYLRKVPGFPNYHFPSDHIAILAEFSFKGKKEKVAHAEPDFGPSSKRDRRD